MHPLTREQPANDFLCDRQKARRQHINFTLSLECALSPHAHVSVFLGPRQPFFGKHQVARISIYDGKEKKATPGRSSSLRVSRRSLRIGAAAWGMGSHQSRKLLPSYPGFSAAPGSTPSPRVHLRPFVSAWKSSHQIRLALSQSSGEGSQQHWAVNHGVATQNITSLSPTQPVRAQHFGPVSSCSQPGAGMAKKRRRSCCQDIQVALTGERTGRGIPLSLQ